MGERERGREPASWTPEEKIALRVLMMHYSSDPFDDGIYTRARDEIRAELERLEEARKYQARAEVFRNERDDRDELEPTQLVEPQPRIENCPDQQREVWDRLRSASASLSAGHLTEFPNGLEPPDEIVYIHSDHPHPNAVPDCFTDTEWAVIAGLHEAARSWREAADDGGTGNLGIREMALPHIQRNLHMAREEWLGRVAELPKTLEEYYGSEFDIVADG